MKKLYLTLLLLLCYVFVYSGQVKYENVPIANWSDLNGVDYSIIYEDEGMILVKLSIGEIIVVIEEN